MNTPWTTLLVTLGIAAAVFGIGIAVTADGADEAAMAGEGVASTEEIQEFDLFWRSLGTLQKDVARIGPDEFRTRLLRVTMDYLQLDGARRQEFVRVAEQALSEVANAEQTVLEQTASLAVAPGSKESPGNVHDRQHTWVQGQETKRLASERLLGVLDSTPRHRLLVERRLLWLLKLDYSFHVGS